MTAVNGLIDRDEERARIGRLLDGLASGFQALVLEGEPGIGKTSIWRAGVADAEARGYRTITARPAEVEKELSFAAMGDLLSGVVDEIGALPDLQADGLRVALLLAPPKDEPPGRRLLGMAVLALLQRLSEERPLVVALDDLQWIDPPSAAVLSFAFRRLTTERVAVLAACRAGQGHAIPIEAADRLAVDPVSLGTIDRLLHVRLGTKFMRPTLLQIERTSGGNPFYALEVARAVLARREPLDPNEQLPVPDDLRQLVRARLGGLSQAAREALLTAAALARPSEDVVSTAVGDPGWLAEALAADVVECTGPNIRFTHPLLPSVLLSDAPLSALRDVHTRLAAIIEDPEERARHLATAASGPDETAASALDEAAGHAYRRGAVHTAGGLAELAVRLTAPEHAEDAHRRLVAAAHYRNVASDFLRAEELVEAALTSAPTGRRRAELLVELARARGRQRWSAWQELLEEALRETGEDDPPLRARIRLNLARLTVFARRDSEHLDSALALAEKLGDRRLLAAALAVRTVHRICLGEPLDERAARRAVTLQDEAGGAWLFDAYWALAWHLVVADRFAEARSLLERHLVVARQAGAFNAIPVSLGLLAQLELAAGRLARSAELAAEFEDATLLAAVASDEVDVQLFNAHLGAFGGELDQARKAAVRGCEMAVESGDWPALAACEHALGLVAFTMGEAEEAHRRFLSCIETIEVSHVGLAPFVEAYDAEVLVELGQYEVAEARLDDFERRAPGRPSALAVAKRTRGLLSAARGAETESITLLEEAVAELEELPRPFELGRALLSLGAVARRQRRRRLARDSLSRAVGVFERIETPLWAAKARSELGQIGGRRAPPGKLTPTEQRIAELVASGRSNAEVARALYVSPKTVEWNLSKIYRKLHVTSRTELAAKLARAQR
jgi:DNA-binding CsgD family transcriptional regulator